MEKADYTSKEVKSDGTQEVLFGVTPEEYGERYQSDYLEMYKSYVVSVDHTSSRRQTANSFFLTLNTAILAFLGYVKPSFGQPIGRLTILATIGGIVICYVWYRLILSYKGLNSGKFKVIHMIENRLPISPYNAEWEAVGRGKDVKKYRPFTRIEIWIPWIFVIIYVISFITLTPWKEVCMALNIIGR